MANALNTITVKGVTQSYSDYLSSTSDTTVAKNNDLGKDAFLQLLVAQIKYQDPLEPQDNSSFVAELAQFSALEQMNNVATNLDALSTVVNGMSSSVNIRQLSSMIGMQVDWLVEDGTFDDDGNPLEQTYTGLITGVNVDDEEPTVSVNVGTNTYKLALSDIERIYNAENTATATTNPTNTTIDTGINVTTTNRSALLGQLGNLIGMDIEWDQPTNSFDADGNREYMPMRGVIRGVNLEGDEPAIIAQVDTDTYKVDVKNVANVYFGLVEPEETEVEE